MVRQTITVEERLDVVQVETPPQPSFGGAWILLGFKVGLLVVLLVLVCFGHNLVVP